MEKRLQKLRLSDLVFDPQLYPRQRGDEAYISQLCEAYRAGSSIPAPVIESQDKLIIDGLHRIEALRRLRGQHGAVVVELRTYQNRRQMFVDAMRLNGNHGLRFQDADFRHCLVLATELRIDPDVKMEQAA